MGAKLLLNPIYLYTNLNSSVNHFYKMRSLAEEIILNQLKDDSECQTTDCSKRYS